MAALLGCLGLYMMFGFKRVNDRLRRRWLHPKESGTGTTATRIC